jgi:threonine/homoserine/homoserine lactone efflux protein
MNLTTYDHDGYALVALLGTLFAVVAVLRIMAQPRFKDRLAALRGVVPPFINIVGVLFGLTLAFIANDTWNAHDKATNAVYREADELRSLMVFSGSMPEPLRSEFRQRLSGYAQSSADEWQQLARRELSPRTDALSAELLLNVASADVLRVVGSNVQAVMLKSMSEIRQARDLRISLSQTHLNPLKWLGMAYLGFLCILSLAAVHVDNPRAAAVAIVLFALSAAPTAAIVLIQGNPFQQPSFVSAKPITAAVELVDS